MRTRYFIGAFAIAGAAAALILAPTAGADPESNLPTCTTTGEGGGYTGTQTTECATPGNVQINATAPEPVYPYPWDDEFYGSAMIIGGGGYGPHGGGGGGGHR
jgi:hypothetical protein